MTVLWRHGDGDEPRAFSAMPAVRTVLVVDDEDGVRDVASLALEEAGYQVLRARDAGEALSLLHEVDQPVDLALIDFNLPGVDGRRLATQISAAAPTTRILYMSGVDPDDLAERGIFPDSWFIQKPFTLTQLTARVQERLV
jgi:two-component system cell cycle sensor histidine kinase/response regulator CckA